MTRLELHKESTIPLYAMVIGQPILFISYFIKSSAVSIEPRANPDIFQIFFLIAGLIILGITVAKYISIYISNKNETRFIVLAALILFTIGFAIKLFKSLWNVSSDIVTASFNTWFYNTITLIFVACTYYMGLFGINVLFSSLPEKFTVIWKKILVLIMLVAYVLFFMDYINQIYLYDRFGDVFGLLVQIVLLSMFGINIINIVYVSIKSFNLSRKTNDHIIRAGLRDLGLSFAIFFSAIVMILLNEVLSYIPVIETIAVMLGVIGFYFVYRGFVKPAEASIKQK